MTFFVNKSFLIVSFFLILLSWSSEGWAKKYPVGSPTRAIQDLDDLLDDYRVGATSAEDKAYNRRLKKRALEGTFDIRKLAEDAMAKHWKDLSTKDQNHFVDVLSQLLERKAVFAREQGGEKSKSRKYTILYKGHRFADGSKEKAVVKSLVKIPSENLTIEINYKVHRVEGIEMAPKDPLLGYRLPAGKIAGNQYRIGDVSVDGASMRDNYRYQFDAIIRKEGYSGLIRRMESKLKGLQEKEQQ